MLRNKKWVGLNTLVESVLIFSILVTRSFFLCLSRFQFPKHLSTTAAASTCWRRTPNGESLWSKCWSRTQQKSAPRGTNFSWKKFPTPVSLRFVEKWQLAKLQLVKLQTVQIRHITKIGTLGWIAKLYGSLGSSWRWQYWLKGCLV